MKELDIAKKALERIASNIDICASYDFDSNPTEQEVAIQALVEIENIKKLTAIDLQIMYKQDTGLDALVYGDESTTPFSLGYSVWLQLKLME